MAQNQKLQSAFGSAVRALPFLVAGGVALLSLTFPLRELPAEETPTTYAVVSFIGSLLCLGVAVNALVRYYGDGNRMDQILALGFGIVGLIEIVSTLDLFVHLSSAAGMLDSMRALRIEYRILLAQFLILAVFVEKPPPHAPKSERRDLATLLSVATVIYVAAAIYFLVEGSQRIRPAARIPRPWELLPSLLFLLAGVGLHARHYRTYSAFDRALTGAAWMNSAAHIILLESARSFDMLDALAQLLMVSSYALVLGGSLLDHTHLFSHHRAYAASDTLTGLGNYRRLIDAIEMEIERCKRIPREFSILLLDIDGLKKINDRFGNDIGNRCLCRLAEALRMNSRLPDTIARYDGDEFAVLLPETSYQMAEGFAKRIQDRLAEQAERPALSINLGVATYPNDGATVEKLLAAMKETLEASKSVNRARGRYNED